MQNTNYQMGHGLWFTNLTPRTIYWYRITTVGTNRVGRSLTNSFATEDTNHPPVANAVSVATYQSYPIHIPLSGSDNASYVPDSIESFRIVQGPTNGTLSATAVWAWNGVGEVTYTPSIYRSFEDHFWYVANDGELDSVPALVTITNHHVNRYPEAGYATYSTIEGVPVPVEMTGWDPDGDPVTFELYTNSPPVGTVSGPLTNLLYTPASGFVGTDTVLYLVSDGSLSALGVILVEVTTTNVAPTAQAQSLTVAEDTTLNVALAGHDVNGDPLTFHITTAPAHGALVGTPPLVQYQPNANFHGADQFSFVANDGRADSPPAVISVAVTPVNDAPVVANQSVTIDEDYPLNLSFLTGSDADGDALTFRVISGPQHGQIVSGGAVYDPERDYAGSDTLTFVANDGQVDSAPATLAITIQNVNDPPLPNTPDATTLEDAPTNIVLTAYNPDNDPLTFQLVGVPNGGTATIDEANVTFTPNLGKNGITFFDYAVSDGVYGVTGRVFVHVTSVEDIPEAYSQSVSTSEDTPVAITLAGFDGDLDPITYSIVNGPANGSLGGTGSNLVYTPSLNFNGTDFFTFKVNDGKGDSAPATVSITVTAVNDPPTLDTILDHTVAEDGPAVTKTLTGVSSGASDETETLSITAVSSNPGLIPNPTVNYTSPSSTGSLTFRSLTNANGTATITVSVSDGVHSTLRIFSVQVSAVNDAPIANGQSVTTAYNIPVNIALTASDVDGNPLVYTVLSSPAHGTLSGTAPNLTFTPTLNWSGNTSFTFRVNDGSLNSATATVNITVSGPTSAPAAPSGLAATAVSRSRIDLAWNDNSTSENGFKIERSANGNSWTQIATVAPNVRNYSATGLSANKTYYFRVRAYNALGNSAYSNTASARTLP
jgi:hypothetical protein